jgi:hypothetical protein
MNLGRFTKMLGGAVLGAAILGIIANLRDVRRYIRMSTM